MWGVGKDWGTGQAPEGLGGSSVYGVVTVVSPWVQTRGYFGQGLRTRGLQVRRHGQIEMRGDPEGGGTATVCL